MCAKGVLCTMYRSVCMDMAEPAKALVSVIVPVIMWKRIWIGVCRLFVVSLMIR